MTSIPPVPFVIATHPPNPNGVGVFTSATVTDRSFRGIFTLSTASLKSPVFPSVVRTVLYSAGMSWAVARPLTSSATANIGNITRYLIDAITDSSQIMDFVTLVYNLKRTLRRQGLSNLDGW